MKNFKVSIVFETQESNIFGGLSKSTLNLAIDQETTEKLVNEFLEDQKNIVIKLPNGVTRYLNTKNILYIDTVEIIEKEGEK